MARFVIVIKTLFRCEGKSSQYPCTPYKKYLSRKHPIRPVKVIDLVITVFAWKTPNILKFISIIDFMVWLCDIQDANQQKRVINYGSPSSKISFPHPHNPMIIIATSLPNN
eukprot:289310_1